MPLRGKEVKARLAMKREQDEITALGLIAGADSVSGGLFRQWGLSRPMIRTALLDLRFNFRVRVVISSIVTGARFKFFEQGERSLLSARCQRCGEIASLAHILICCNVGPGVFPDRTR